MLIINMQTKKKCKFPFSDDDIIIRMRSLRTVYRKTLLAKPSGSAGDTLTTAEKQIMELCAFLQPYLQNRETSSNLPKTQKTKQASVSIQRF
jgi:hypothetical protein